MRTDLTAICTTCGSRFSRALRTCPQCGHDTVADLRDTARRAGALDMVRREQGRAGGEQGQRPDFIRHALVAIALSILLGLVVHQAVVVAGIVLAIGYVVVGNMVWPRGTFADVVELPAPRSMGTNLLVPPPPDDRRPLRGRIHVDEPVVAPLSGVTCAAFRILGRDDQDNIVDDAAIGQLQLETDAGEQLVIRAAAARVAIETGPASRVASPSTELRAFLAERGVADDAALWLAEAVLVDGDEVLVRGDLGEHVGVPAAGYRDTEWRRLLVEGRAGLLSIERAPP